MQFNVPNPETTALFWINRVGFLARTELVSRFRAQGYDTTAEEWAILLQLWHADDLPTGQLAERSIRDKSTMTRLLDGMVRKDLVERRADPNDRRRVRVRLSTKARGVFPELADIARGLITDSLTGVDEAEADALMATLRRIERNFLDPGAE